MWNWESLGSASASPPAIVRWGESGQTLFVFAAGTDQALWYREFSGTAWGTWQSLGGILMSPPHAWSNGFVVEVFAVGADSSLLHWHFENGAWTGCPPEAEMMARNPAAGNTTYERYWESLGGVIVSPPCASFEGDIQFQETFVFAAGTDHALWFRQREPGQSWDDWQSLGGTLTSPPFAASNGSPFVFALFPDHAVWFTRRLGEVWQPWKSLGGTFTSRPCAVADADNTMHVFAVGTDAALRHQRVHPDGSADGSWESLGGIAMSPPYAVSHFTPDIPDAVDVFVLGADSGMWRQYWNGNSWYGWESMGGTFTSPPCATESFSPHSVNVVTLDTHHTVQYVSYGVQ